MFTVKQFEKGPGILSRKRRTLNLRVTDEEMAQRLGITVPELHNKIDKPDLFTEDERQKMVEVLDVDVVKVLQEAYLVERAAEKGEISVDSIESAMDRIEAALDGNDPSEEF